MPKQKCKKYDICDTSGADATQTTSTDLAVATSTEPAADVTTETFDCISSKWHPDMTVSFIRCCSLLVDSQYVNRFRAL
jgi:hypothetical protein